MPSHRPTPRALRPAIASSPTPRGGASPTPPGLVAAREGGGARPGGPGHRRGALEPRASRRDQAHRPRSPPVSPRCGSAPPTPGRPGGGHPLPGARGRGARAGTSGPRAPSGAAVAYALSRFAASGSGRPPGPLDLAFRIDSADPGAGRRARRRRPHRATRLAPRPVPRAALPGRPGPPRRRPLRPAGSGLRARPARRAGVGHSRHLRASRWPSSAGGAPGIHARAREHPTAFRWCSAADVGVAARRARSPSWRRAPSRWPEPGGTLAREVRPARPPHPLRARRPLRRRRASRPRACRSTGPGPSSPRSSARFPRRCATSWPGSAPPAPRSWPSLDPVAFASAIEQTANRAGPAPLRRPARRPHRARRAAAPGRRPGCRPGRRARARPDLADLARFALSDPYLVLRGMLLGWP